MYYLLEFSTAENYDVCFQLLREDHGLLDVSNEEPEFIAEYFHRICYSFTYEQTIWGKEEEFYDRHKPRKT